MEYKPDRDLNHWAYYASSSYDMYTGSARIYYDSPYVQIDDNLTSPSIDCSGMSTVRLDFNCYFYSYTTYQNKGYVQVSTDGGTTWQDVDFYEIVSPGSYGYSIAYEWYNGYDISAIAAGHSDVKVRFRFTRPALPGNGGYWYLDNVRVHDGSGVFKFIETFDTGKAVYFTVFKNYVHDVIGGFDRKPVKEPYYNNKWQSVTSGTTPTCTPYEGARMAQYYSNVYQGMQAMLYKKTPVNVASANTLKLSFMMFHDTIGGGKIDVLASHDGITWQNVGTFNRQGTVNQWVEHQVNAWREIMTPPRCRTVRRRGAYSDCIPGGHGIISLPARRMCPLSMRPPNGRAFAYFIQRRCGYQGNLSLARFFTKDS